MAIINTIRTHSGLVVGLVISGLILFLIGGDIMRLGPMLSGKHRTEVGEIAGQKVSVQTYQNQIEQLRQQIPPQTMRTIKDALVRDQAWRQLIMQTTCQKEYDALGLTVSEDELVDMVQGEHIYPELKAFFTDPETQKFDKQRLVKHLQALAQLPEAQQAQWRNFENALSDLRKREKFFQLMQQSAWTTDLEAKAKDEAANTTLHIKCLYVPYYTRPDDEVQVTEAMLKDYLAVHKSAYQIEESRSIKYLNFPITPTQEDEQAFSEALQALKNAFVETRDDRTFAKTNTDGAPLLSYFNLTAEQLPSTLLQQKAGLSKGLVVGPVQEGDLHKLYKVVAINPKAAKQYEIAIIEKRLVPGEQAKDQVFRKADYCASAIKNVIQLEDYAAQEGFNIYDAQVGKNDTQVGGFSNARELVRWLYNDAAVGQVSPVFELENNYVIAVMAEHVPQGTAPLKQVRNEIALKVRNEDKGKAIMAQLKALAGKTLEEKAAQYGQEARIIEVKQLYFDENTIKSAGMARKAVGAAFALQQGEQTTVADENGILVVELVAKNTTEPTEDTVAHKQSLAQLEKIKQPYYVLESMQELAKVKDYRYRFY